MLDPLVVEEHFRDALKIVNCDSSERVQLMRIIEFFEVLLETRSNDLIFEYAPPLIVRTARVLSQIEFTDENISISDRLMPVLWLFVNEYPEVGNRGICLAMLHLLTEAQARLEVIG